jgi:hypothetical protein
LHTTDGKSFATTACLALEKNGRKIVEDQQYHAVVEVIAAMKSNRGSTQQWIKELESALEIEEMKVNDNNSGRAPK